MRITITTPGRFPPAFHAARYHDRRGELARIVSPVPAARARPLRHLCVAHGRPDAARRLEPRRDALCAAFVRRTHQTAFSATFDEIASRMIGDVDVVNPWQSTALRTIRAAHRRGIPSVLEAASAHVLTQVDLLREEMARFGADLDNAVLSPRVIDRTLAEYDEATQIVANSEFARASFIAHGVAPRR